ncbi:MAG: DUF3526 domain-containing protein [Methylophaga sp.]|nr:DUF3526 domain-containing protein [Methylophaga sp.]
MTDIKMIGIVFCHELQKQARSRTLRLLGPLLLLLTLLVAAAHWQQQRDFTEMQAYWQAENDAAWQAQPDRHPHRVAHYGTMAFRTLSALNFLDAGVNPFVGNALFLEAHRQNSSHFRQYMHSTAYMGLGYLSAATIILVLWPLVLVTIAFASISQERERGTLSLLLSMGVSLRQLWLGKAAAYLLISVLFLLMIFAIAVLFMASDSSAAVDMTRLFVLFVLYLGYSLIWIMLILTLSQYAATSYQALLQAVLLWAVLVVMLPKLIFSLGAHWYPMPDRASFEAQLEQLIAEVGDSHNPDDPHFSAFRQSVLDEYGVSSVEDLPVNWRGLVMTEGERITSEVFNEQYQQLLQQAERQNRLFRGFALLSPYMLTAELSSRLAASDAASFYFFEVQAESYRYELIQQLNQLHTHEVDLAHDRQTRLSQDFWQNFEMFELPEQSLGQSLQQGTALIVTWLVWLLLLSGLGGRYNRSRGARA